MSLWSGHSREGGGHDEQKTLVKEKMVLGVKVIRVEKEILVHEGDVVEDGWAVPLTTGEGFTKEVTFYQDHCSMGCRRGH